MLYKAIALILSTLFIAAIQISAASAGCGGGHGFRGHQASFAHRQAIKQSKARKAQSVAAAKQKKAVQQARAEKAPAKVAKAEPAPAKDKTQTIAEKTDAAESAVTVASAEPTCTRFFAETGTTVTVECAKQ